MTKRLRIWLDDIRTPPNDTWTWVKTVGEVIELLKYGEPCWAISLDYDLQYTYAGGESGLDAANFIREQAIKGIPTPRYMSLHTDSAVGRTKMSDVLRSARKMGGRVGDTNDQRQGTSYSAPEGI